MTTDAPQQLSLFGAAPASLPKRPRAGGESPPPSTSPPPDSSPAPLFVLTPQPWLPPTGYRRKLLLRPGEPLEYGLRRSHRRSIGLTIRDAHLLIQAPSWASQSQIETAIHTKADWIDRKLRAAQQRLDVLAVQPAQWRKGGHIPYLGVMIELALDSARTLHFSGNQASPDHHDLLFLPLPDNAGPSRIQERTQGWLQEQARRDFGIRLQATLARAGQTILDWRLSNAQGRWGSCSSTRRIHLNWRLIHLPSTLIDYVVAHEVAHLTEMNHSPAFWREVEHLYPDFKQARDALAQHHPGSLPLF
ncbi:M48 family metallopeptidase [Castellaniella sp.]|uniref:M48 family metallopeptidase n=1 Tax=Castellaniella sp. TaxID=1955812 RepID=UPI003C715DC5